MSALVNTAPAYIKPSNLAQNTVLTTILATHGDLALSKGVMTCTGGISLKLTNATGYAITNYTAGQVQTSVVDFTSISAADNAVYKIVLMTKADDQVYTVEIVSGTGATPSSIAAQFQQAISNNASFPVTATVNGAVLILVENSTSTGGFNFTSPTGAVNSTATYLTMGAITGTFQLYESVSQATSGATGTIATINGSVIAVYAVTGTFDTSHTVTGGTSGATATPSAVGTANDIQPSGIPAQVSVFAGQNIASGQFRLYAISFVNQSPNSVQGVGQNAALAYIWADETATNFSAFDTELKAILGGTHTPASDYLGA